MDANMKFSIEECTMLGIGDAVSSCSTRVIYGRLDWPTMHLFTHAACPLSVLSSFGWTWEEQQQDAPSAGVSCSHCFMVFTLERPDVSKSRMK